MSHLSPFVSDSVTLNELSRCKVLFAPSNNPTYSKIMQNVDVGGGADVTGFPDVKSLQLFVASSLGEVDFAVFFIDKTLWTLGAQQQQQEDVINYVIFHNSTADLRSPSEENLAHGLNVRLLALQKQVEHGILKHRTGQDALVYDVTYASLAALEGFTSQLNASSSSRRNLAQPTASASASASANMSDPSFYKCSMEKNDFDHLVLAVSWTFSFGLLCIGVVAFQLVAEERTKGLFTSLRRLGLCDSAYWLSWLAAFEIIIFAGAILAVVVAGAYNAAGSLAINHMDMGIVFLVLWLGGSACVANGFFLASIAHKPSMHTLAIFLNFILLVLTIAFNSTPLDHYEMAGITNSQTGLTTTSCVLIGSSYNKIYSDEMLLASTVRFIVFFMPWFHVTKAFLDVFSRTQFVGKNFAYADLALRAEINLYYDVTNPVSYTGFGVRTDLLNLLALTVTYLVLAWFFAQVLSGDAGEGRTVQSVLLPPQLLRLLGLGSLSSSSRVTPVGNEEGLDEEDFDVRGREQRLSRQAGSVRVYKCSKTYSGVQALKEVSFTVSKGECFVLLGHNGAGKSSLLNILTGVARPTHGKVYVAGMDVEQDVSKVQQSIGVCPQDNFLFDDLSAYEHMRLHAAFKGIPAGPELDGAVSHVLARLQLLRRSQTLARNFSGGMKRRLSVAMAAVGDAAVIVLDEPGAGLDPLSRRYLWDCINWLKKSRVLILTTHNLDEADYLGDTIMLLHNGRVKAKGDPLFLKTTYGTGLSVRLNVDGQEAQSVINRTKLLLPHSWPVGDWASGLITLNVPTQDTAALAGFFAWVESPEGRSVREWSLANTSLEQVFMQVCVNNTEINVAGSSDQDHTQALAKLCPLCHIRNREPVVLRVPSEGHGNHIIVPDAMCFACTQNESFFLGENDWRDVVALSSASSDPHVIEEEGRLATTGLPQQMQRQQRMKLFLRQAYLRARERNRQSLEAVRGVEEDQDQEQGQQLVPAGFASVPTHDFPQAPATASSMTLNPLMQQQQQQAQPTVAASPFSSSTGPSRSVSQINSGCGTQTKAIILKNLTLQGHQPCTNICVLIFAALMLLSLSFFEWLFRFRGVSSCPGGWVTASDCSIELLTDHIFSANPIALPGFKSNTELHRRGKLKPAPKSRGGGRTLAGDDSAAQDDAPQSTDDGDDAADSDWTLEGTYIPWGFTPQHYLIPSAAYSPVTPDGPTLTGCQRDGTTQQNLCSYGLPVYTNRFPGVWSSFPPPAAASNSGANASQASSTQALFASSVSTAGLGLQISAFPASVAAGSQTPEESMLGAQRQAAEYIAAFASTPHVAYPLCESFAPQLLVLNGTLQSLGSYTQWLPDPEGQSRWRRSYADAVFDCTSESAGQCPAADGSSQGFVGKLWLARAGRSNSVYKTAVLDLFTGPLTSTQQQGGGGSDDDDGGDGGGGGGGSGGDPNILMGAECPPDVALMTLGSLAGPSDPTLIAMTYSNLLANSLLDPSVQTLAIQGAVSPFGALFFNFLLLTEFVSTFLTIFLVLLFNALWPLSVWRLAYERSSGIAGLMKSIGLRPWAYLAGMYLCDVGLQLALSLQAVLVAKYMDLSVFHDAPAAALCFTALLSAHAITALGLLAVRALPVSSRLTSALAAAVSIFSTIFSVLLQIFYYKDEGTWPRIYNAVPFFAQTRAVFLLLVYNQVTDEVASAWAALFAVGLVCVLAAFAIDEDPLKLLHRLHGALHAALVRLRFEDWGSGGGRGGGRGRVRGRAGTGSSVSVRDVERDVVYMDVSLRGKQSRDRDRRASSRGHSSSSASDADGIELGSVGGGKGWRSLPDSAHTTASEHSAHSGASASLVRYEPTAPDVVAERDAALAYSSSSSPQGWDPSSHLGSPAPPLPAAGTRTGTGGPGGGGYAIVMQSVRHTYTPLGASAALSTPAIRQLSLALPYGEVFGLLGPNGSGKSTTIGLLTGLVKPSHEGGAGRIFMAGWDIEAHPEAVHRLIGVCPQHDVVWNELTVQEHLEFQCRQRGIPEYSINSESQRAAIAVGLDGDAFRTPAANLSGGMRRRLSIGMSIVGDPPLLVLDECSAGLDPENRQRIWQVIQSLRRPDRLILLTTHSMTEAEALCSRIGILAHGTLQCVGTPLALRFRYSQTYTLTINLHPAEGGAALAQDELDDWVRGTVGDGDAELTSTVNCTRRYSVPKTAGSIGRIFDLLEAAKDSGRPVAIREWGVGLTTLEDVFIRAVEAAEEGAASLDQDDDDDEGD
jgi:ABC-type multidrug transport system ATPase subunit